MWRWSCLGLLLAAAVSMLGQAPHGIPRELAAQRASDLSELRYGLSFTLEPHGASSGGREELRFELKRAAPLLLDFREGSVTNLIVNGHPISVEAENGHIKLPAVALRGGHNDLTLDFSAPVALAGKAITRYEDKDDGSEYIYTLFVPMDASMAFPCFDQPDLKGRFTLQVTAPMNWTVISNTNEQRKENISGGTTRRFFEETRPISTYLFAFAAGPFRNVHAIPGMPNIYVRQSQAGRAQPEVPQIQNVTARGMKFLADYFAQPYPFPKYEMALIPGLAYGGMEHAGATFLNEESMLFRIAPTATDRFNRSITVLHELTHQWFGDFTTMRWFDDLWLKEGFAQYMAFRAMVAIEPDQHVWKRFYEQIKPAAYGIDVTKGTTPIYQEIPNLKDAKSAYGAIVYSKAPGLLRQLAFMLGDERFRNGLRIYLHEHQYGNAEWSDLVRCFERASGQNLQRWAEAWIQRRGMPEVDVAWSCNAEHRLKALTLRQHNVLDGGGVWPLATEVLLGYANGPAIRVRAQLMGETAEVPEAAGKACPAYIFADDEDYAYGLFLLDNRSRGYLLEHMGSISDLFERALLWGSVWDSVRFAALAPRDYLSVVLRNLPSDPDEMLVRSLGARSTTALHRYVNPGTRSKFVPGFESLAIGKMIHAPQQDLRIMWFRTLVGVATTRVALEELKALLNGKLSIPGVQLRSRDRWNMVATLIAQGDPEANEVYESEKQRDHTGDGLKYSYAADAAKPDSRTKKWYFNDYLHNPARPEDWVSGSLGEFNEWNQAELTFPYLRPALDALPEIKQQRKIFFVLGWVDAFIGGQQSAAADAEVHGWLNSTQLDPDLRLKVLQVVDELDRTVRIRQRFP
jgi:aminopeptidase N